MSDAQSQSLLFGVAALTFIGAGFRAVVLGFALLRGEASSPERAGIAAVVFAVLALLGGATLAWLWAGHR